MTRRVVIVGALLAGCGDPPRASSPNEAATPPNAQESTTESHPAVAITISQSGKYSVSCPATGTALAVPSAWQKRLARLSESEVVIECRDCGGVLNVASTKGEPDLKQLLAKLGELHERLTGRTLYDTTISKITSESGRTELHYGEGVAPGPEAKGAYVLSGFLVARDRATCEILVVETEAAWLTRSALSPLLGGILDSRWRDAEQPAQPLASGEDLLRAMLTVGAYVIKAAPR